MKKIILGIIIGVAISGAVYAMSANDIEYKNNMNVTEALDDLYSKVNSSKTLLWQNTNPTASLNGTDLNLNSSLTNFTHILIQYKVNTETSVIYEDLFDLTYERPNTNNANKAAFAIGAFDETTTLIYRGIRVTDSTTLRMGNAINTSAVTKSNYIIPIAIYGLNLSY